jgi:Periplasmic component of the Tol biopolymer transport system
MADLPDEETEQTPQWFPDSNRLAYVSGLVDNRGTTLGDSPTNLYTIQADGTGRTKVIERPPKSHIQSVVISPDGSQIAFVGREWDSGLPEKVAVYCVNADGSNLRELMVFPPPAYFAELFWSPDGSKVFAFDPTVEYPAILYVIQPDRVPVEQPDLLHIPGHFTRWRWASGSEIEIAACEHGVGTSIWTVNANDLSLRKRMSIPGEQCVGIRAGGWSPDGAQIAFSEYMGPPELLGLYVLDVNSGCERQILGEYYVLDLFWLPVGVAIP